MEQRGHIEWNVKDLVQRRNKFPDSKETSKIIDKQNIQRSFAKFPDSTLDIEGMVSWLEKMARYIPISSDISGYARSYIPHDSSASHGAPKV